MNTQDPVIKVREAGQARSAEDFSDWRVSLNLTDRWGDLNDHDKRNKPLALLERDRPLFDRLRSQMWDEITFVVRKDGAFGILYEVEYCSRESETRSTDPLRPEAPAHSEVVGSLLTGMGALRDKFPGVLFAVPTEEVVVWRRPAAWAFVPDGHLDAPARERLGKAMLEL